jgi:sugar (pentulose or hexulose) kinase
MSFIGIDLGTSFIKGAVLDLEARQLKHIHRLPFPHQLHGSNPLFCEFNPDEIVSVFQNLLATLFAAAPDCTGIVMCTQMHGMVLMNEAGKILSPCLTWRDQRATMPHPSGEGTYFEVMTGRIGCEQRAQLGNELRPGTPSSFLFWMAEQGKLKSGLIPVTIPDFVLSVLTGSKPSVESTNGMAYGLLNLETMDWHHEVIEALGLSQLRWPTVRKHGEIVGHLKLSARSVPCYAPVGDYQCALLGALLNMDELSLNVSTGSQVSRLTEDLELGDYQSRPFFDGKFLNTFTHIPAGRALDVLVDLVSEVTRRQQVELQDPWSYIGQEALKLDDTDLQVDLNFFSSPFGERGTISNIRQDNLTVGHLFRAAFNNMTDRYYNCAQRIWPERAWQRLVFSGGLIGKLEALRQVIQKRFQSEYRMAPFAEDTLTGLLIMALAFSGNAASIDEATNNLRRNLPTSD